MNESREVYDYGYCVRFYQGCPESVADFPRDGVSGRKGQLASQADVMGFGSILAAKTAGMSYAVEQANAHGYICMEPEKEGIVDVCTVEGQRLFNVALLREPVKQLERRNDNKYNKPNLPRKPIKRPEVEITSPVCEYSYCNELTL